jgi:hypothetical protein
MTANKPGPKLNEEQRNALLVWLAAEYSGPLIKKWFAEREWPEISDAGVSYYRKEWAEEIADARSKRRRSALSQGIALKEERIRRLAEHADELEAIKWLPDDKGRLWNEKAWRETLDDIAKEMGHRRQGVDVRTATEELEAALDRLRDNLSDEEYRRVLAALAGSDTPSGA